MGGSMLGMNYKMLNHYQGMVPKTIFRLFSFEKMLMQTFVLPDLFNIFDFHGRMIRWNSNGEPVMKFYN